MRVEQLEELRPDTFVAGSFITYEFKVIDEDDPDTPVDLSSFLDIRWVLFKLGDPDNPLLSLPGEVSASEYDIFDVSIDSEYTENLSSLYMHQVILTDSQNRKFIPTQGLINIIPKANEDNSSVIVNTIKKNI